MCRLYGLQSTHATKVGCELIEAQNSLIRQCVEDERGLSNPHGWGVGSYRDGALTCERQVGPASESEPFRRYAATIEAPAGSSPSTRSTSDAPHHRSTDHHSAARTAVSSEESSGWSSSTSRSPVEEITS